MSSIGSKARTVSCLSALTLCACLLSAAPAAGQLQISRIARTGDPVPGQPGASWFDLWSSQIDNDGDLLIKAEVIPAGAQFGAPGIWYGSPSGFDPIAIRDEQAPGFEAGVTFHDLHSERLNLRGDVAFGGWLRGPGIEWGVNDRALWHGVPNSVSVAAQGGDPAPGAGEGVVFRNARFSPRLGRSGHVAILHPVAGPGVNESNALALWVKPAHGGLELVARSGHEAPGTGGLIFSSSILTTGFFLNGGGNVAFPAVVGSQPGQVDAAGIWVGGPGTLQAVMVTGNPAPGTPKGTTFVDFFGPLGFSSQDRATFLGGLAGPDVKPDNNIGVWWASPDELALIAREGDPAPGIPGDVEFAAFGQAIPNESGSLILDAILRGEGVGPDNERAVWFGPPDDLELLFREGDHAFGLPEGVVFSFETFRPLFAVNGRGDMFMQADLGGPGVDGSNDRAYWFRDGPTEEWFLVARDGGLFDGEVLTELFFHETGAGEGASPSVNEAGVVTFHATFGGQNDNGIHTVRMPEPNVFVWAGGLSLVLRRRKHERRRQ